MTEILSTDKIATISKEKKEKGETVVLAGGCFDILHPGHVVFLEKAKKAGDILVVLLESDQKVRELKGVNRPVHTQKERAKVLSALQAVDYVIMLPYMEFDTQYDELIARIKPDIVVASSKDVNTSHHQRAAKKVGAKFKLVAKVIGTYSTSKILNH